MQLAEREAIREKYGFTYDEQEHRNLMAIQDKKEEPRRREDRPTEEEKTLKR
jgi:hypothetical protein